MHPIFSPGLSAVLLAVAMWVCCDRTECLYCGDSECLNYNSAMVAPENR